MELRGDRVVLRSFCEGDIAAVAAIGREPEVARWWPDLPDDEPMRERLERGTGFTVLLDGEVVGFAQYWEEDDPEFRHAGIDLALSARVHGRGLGRDTVRTLARHVVRELGHHRVTIDPALANERAVRCYEAVGFRRVGVLRRYWRGPDGRWQDGLLLDLLAEELD